MEPFDIDNAIDEVKELKLIIENEIPSSRERSLAITKLEEAMFWLSEAKNNG